MAKVPGYKNVSAATARALVNVLDAINARDDAKFPSKDVQRKALRLLDRPHTDENGGGVRQHASLAKVYDVLSEDGENIYSCELFIEGEPSEIVTVRCSCPATTTCAHLLAALTHAERDGLSLAV